MKLQLAILQLLVFTTGADRYEYDKKESNVTIPADSERRLPEAIIIGVRKCGTRALLAFSGLNPRVITAEREVHYFDRNYKNGPEWYRNQMPYSTSNQITMEKTPGYFINTLAPMRIKAFNPNVKVS